MLGEAGSAGSHLARPAVEERTQAVTRFVHHIIHWHKSSDYSVSGVMLDPVIAVKVETWSLASKTKLRERKLRYLNYTEENKYMGKQLYGRDPFVLKNDLFINLI